MSTRTVYKISELRDLIDQKKPSCICGKPLTSSGLDFYGPHDGGVLLEGYDEPQWVYVHCKKCRYDMALWKIARELGNIHTPQTGGS